MKPELNIEAQSYVGSHWELHLTANDNRLADWFFSAARNDRIVYAIGTHGSLSYFRGKPDVSAACEFLDKRGEAVILCQRRIDKEKYGKYEYIAIRA